MEKYIIAVHVAAKYLGLENEKISSPDGGPSAEVPCSSVPSTVGIEIVPSVPSTVGIESKSTSSVTKEMPLPISSSASSASGHGGGGENPPPKEDPSASRGTATYAAGGGSGAGSGGGGGDADGTTHQTVASTAEVTSVVTGTSASKASTAASESTAAEHNAATTVEANASEHNGALRAESSSAHSTAAAGEFVSPREDLLPRAEDPVSSGVVAGETLSSDVAGENAVAGASVELVKSEGGDGDEDPLHHPPSAGGLPPAAGGPASQEPGTENASKADDIPQSGENGTPTAPFSSPTAEASAPKEEGDGAKEGSSAAAKDGGKKSKTNSSAKPRPPKKEKKAKGEKKASTTESASASGAGGTAAAVVPVEEGAGAIVPVTKGGKTFRERGLAMIHPSHGYPGLGQNFGLGSTASGTGSPTEIVSSSPLIVSIFCFLVCEIDLFNNESSPAAGKRRCLQESLHLPIFLDQRHWYDAVYCRKT